MSKGEDSGTGVFPSSQLCLISVWPTSDTQESLGDARLLFASTPFTVIMCPFPYNS